MGQESYILVSVGLVVLGISIWLVAMLVKKGLRRKLPQDTRNELDKLMDAKNQRNIFR